MANVLLVDDDIELSGMLKEFLEHEGFSVDAVHDGEQGVDAALSGRYAIVVLDVMMPRLNGVEVLRRVRMSSQVPVLMLTARGDGTDRVVGLELGADDYVPKPCTARELSARIRAILRRTGGEALPADSQRSLSAGPLAMWPTQRRATWLDDPLELTSAEFNLLELLVRNAGRLVSKSDLSEQGLGRPLARFDRAVDVHISSLRHKLGQLPDGRSWIQTVRGMGYQFIRE